MKIPKRQMKLIGEYIKKYKLIFNFSDWMIIVDNEYKDLHNSYAEINYDQYERTIDIVFDKSCKDVTNNELEGIVVHELTHISIAYHNRNKNLFIQNLIDYIKDTLDEDEERLAVRLTKTVLKR